ncbi:Zn-ribbon domain-containing OB-fold protein [Pollutimonas bauzanensis]|uniref:DUF35 domain-containing protein n=1 Tax=Pollutimonas bauzanensis TaxID=658167 RepID=A0A1M5R4F0_9BURK|nr:OB-fold domain-containing protein [Pollutimonas bauzanensis]SHH20859.1 hypothetical protein SAMN04488135_102460 [Pollutimonas bauzanensis]
MSQETALSAIPPTPQPVMGLYDEPMWQSIREGAMRLQCCKGCGQFQYPPAPVCGHCLSSELEWQALSGRGRVISWVIFHKSYLGAYPAPYNVAAVRLEEGPVLISNLEPPVPEGSWIGTLVKMTYITMADGFRLPRFIMDGESRKQA